MKKSTLFDEWSEAELALRNAQVDYKEATKRLVERITELNVSWPCDMDDPEFVSIECESGPVMLELKPLDEPAMNHMPFHIHHLEKLKL